MQHASSSQSHLTVRVVRRVNETPDICSFVLAATDGQPLPAFSAGSHIDVIGPSGLTRQYSLCNDESDRSQYVIGVLRDPGSRGGSLALHDQVHEGSTLQISVPRNHFALDPGGGHSLLFAGGIGVTPLLSMASSLTRSNRSFKLHYCTRSSERAAFIDAIRCSEYASRVQFHFDDGLNSQKLNLDECLGTFSSDTHLYVCGPRGFMDAVLGHARRLGWAESQLHFEFFAGVENVSSHDDEGFEVEIASTGQVIRVARDESVAQALLGAGVDISISCSQGVCGTCLTRVLSGVPEHRDMFLTPSEQAACDQFLPCCSRAKSPRLVLDL